MKMHKEDHNNYRLPVCGTEFSTAEERNKHTSFRWNKVTCKTCLNLRKKRNAVSR